MESGRQDRGKRCHPSLADSFSGMNDKETRAVTSGHLPSVVPPDIMGTTVDGNGRSMTIDYDPRPHARRWRKLHATGAVYWLPLTLTLEMEIAQAKFCRDTQYMANILIMSYKI
jgi:hypothetical protein